MGALAARAGRRWQEGPITLGFLLVPPADAEAGGRERGVPHGAGSGSSFCLWFAAKRGGSCVKHTALPDSSAPGTLGAGEAAKGLGHLFVTKP